MDLVIGRSWVFEWFVVRPLDLIQSRIKFTSLCLSRRGYYSRILMMFADVQFCYCVDKIIFIDDVSYNFKVR